MWLLVSFGHSCECESVRYFRRIRVKDGPPNATSRRAKPAAGGEKFVSKIRTEGYIRNAGCGRSRFRANLSRLNHLLLRTISARTPPKAQTFAQWRKLIALLRWMQHVKQLLRGEKNVCMASINARLCQELPHRSQELITASRHTVLAWPIDCCI